MEFIISWIMTVQKGTNLLSAYQCNLFNFASKKEAKYFLSSYQSNIYFITYTPILYQML